MKNENRILLGDCLTVLKTLDDCTVNMVYLDPPFFTQDKQELSTKAGEIYSFQDSWSNMQEYISFLEVRMLECKRVLKDDGTIFVHCDKHASHYIKVMLDNIFGYNNFKNDIIWSYKRWSNNKCGLQNNHQNILFYSKNKQFTFNTIHTDYSPTTNLDQILRQRKRDDRKKSVYSDDVCEQKNGVPMGDVWDIPFLNPKAKERVGYPTQKPIILLERIIELSTNEGNIILDPFCGSGTTLVAAKMLNRRYIGIDVSIEAVTITESRLIKPIKSESFLLKNGVEKYITKNDKQELLKLIDAKVVHRNKNVDGLINSSVGIVPVRIQNENENAEDAMIGLSKFTSDKNLKYSVLLIKKQTKSLFENDGGSTLTIDLSTFGNIDFTLKDKIHNWLCTI